MGFINFIVLQIIQYNVEQLPYQITCCNHFLLLTMLLMNGVEPFVLVLPFLFAQLTLKSLFSWSGCGIPYVWLLSKLYGESLLEDCAKDRCETFALGKAKCMLEFSCTNRIKNLEIFPHQYLEHFAVMVDLYKYSCFQFHSQ